mgnify:CR=1 FL=1
MIKQYGRAYIDYMNSVPMFLPKNIGGRIYAFIFGRIKSKTLGVLMLYIISLVISILFALELRNYSISKIPIVPFNGLSAISVLPAQDREIAKILGIIKKGNPLNNNLLSSEKANLVYVMPSDFFLMAIVTDMERLYPVEFERPLGGNVLIRFIKIFINYTKMQLGLYPDEHDIKRIIFISVKKNTESPLKDKAMFSFGAKRYPLFYADIEVDKGEIISFKQLKPKHKWGESPMPIF